MPAPGKEPRKGDKLKSDSQKKRKGKGKGKDHDTQRAHEQPIGDAPLDAPLQAGTDSDNMSVKFAKGKQAGRKGKHKQEKDHGKSKKKQRRAEVADTHLDTASVVVPSELPDAERSLTSDPPVLPEPVESLELSDSRETTDVTQSDMVLPGMPDEADAPGDGEPSAGQAAARAAAAAAEKATAKAAKKAAKRERKAARASVAADAVTAADSASASVASGTDDASATTTAANADVPPDVLSVASDVPLAGAAHVETDEADEQVSSPVDVAADAQPDAPAPAAAADSGVPAEPSAAVSPAELPPMEDPASVPATPVASDTTHLEPTALHSDLALLSHDDIYLFNEGRHQQLYDRLGAHRQRRDGRDGWHFAVWAPNAARVAVTGDFNGWDDHANHLEPFYSSGIWTGFVPEAEAGQVYKYVITAHDGERLEKADPFATRAELPPRTGSVLWELDYAWNDHDWMEQRARYNAADAPMSIYEVHLGSWRHRAGEGDRWLTYRELSEPLAEHVTTMGFTHVEFLPVMEHPFYGSWGYQGTGYFAPTSRYGTPQDFMYLVDHLHQRGIGVILDWVPSHFPDDPHGLYRFDGTHLFEHADPRQGFHPDWGSMIFNYGRNEVRSFLLSSAIYWLERFHADGLRVDAVASMLYLDYSRKVGEWVPNQFGGRENLEAVDFLRQLNTDVYARFPDVQVIAEESTAWPGVSRPVYTGGLGFGMKWDMGWMHDTLLYFSHDPIHRRFHHNDLTFRMVYAYDENFVLPFSHDEVVHGKGSMLGRMVGDDWQQFANLRLLYSYMFTMPGKKLLFMGSEFGARAEWNHEASLDWEESRSDAHRGIAHLVGDLNRLLRSEPALQRLDFSPAGFTWLESNDADASVLAYMRNSGTPGEEAVCVFNLTPVPRYGYRIGVPQDGYWREALNSDAGVYWGSSVGNLGGVHAEPTPWHGQPFSIPLTLPPLAALVLRRDG